MSTYAKTLSEFENELNLTLSIVDKSQLGVGVENWPVVDQDISARVQIMKEKNLDLLCVWKAPLSDEWMNTILKDFC